MKTLSWGDVLQSHVEEALVSSRYPYKNVFINNTMQQQLAQADVVLGPCQSSGKEELLLCSLPVCVGSTVPSEVHPSRTACPKKGRAWGCAGRGAGRSDQGCDCSWAGHRGSEGNWHSDCECPGLC